MTVQLAEILAAMAALAEHADSVDDEAEDADAVRRALAIVRAEAELEAALLATVDASIVRIASCGLDDGWLSPPELHDIAGRSSAAARTVLRRLWVSHRWCTGQFTRNASTDAQPTDRTVFVMNKDDEVRNTWAERELPILRIALREIDAGQHHVALEAIRSETGLEVDQMRAASRALESAGYIEVQGRAMGPRVSGYVMGVGERTRRELGSWPAPDNVVARLIAALDQAAEEEAEPERKSKLRAVAQGLGGVARDIAVGAISAQLGNL